MPCNGLGNGPHRKSCTWINRIGLGSPVSPHGDPRPPPARGHTYDFARCTWPESGRVMPLSEYDARTFGPEFGVGGGPHKVARCRRSIPTSPGGKMPPSPRSLGIRKPSRALSRVSACGSGVMEFRAMGISTRFRPKAKSAWAAVRGDGPTGVRRQDTAAPAAPGDRDPPVLLRPTLLRLRRWRNAGAERAAVGAQARDGEAHHP